MAAIRKIKNRPPARRKPVRKTSNSRRVSPIKPGLTGARNWATAQVRAASYSRKKMVRLVVSGIVLFLAVLWAALWLGGFIPNIQAAGDKFTKTRLMAMGFVVDHVDVVGEGRISESDVRAALGVQPGDYLFDMDIKTAQKRIESLSWVDSAVIRRLWPNRVVVHINERRPYALWQNNNVIHLVDGSGIVISDANIPDFNVLPLIVGPGAAEHAHSIMSELEQRPDMQKQVSAVIFIGERRWDLIMDSGMRIKLPEHNLDRALDNLERFQNEQGVLDLDLESIDMRVEGRVSLMPQMNDRGRRA